MLLYGCTEILSVREVAIMSYEFMNTINMHLENQRLCEYENKRLERHRLNQRRENIIYGIVFGLVLLAAFILDTPH